MSNSDIINISTSAKRWHKVQLGADEAIRVVARHVNAAFTHAGHVNAAPILRLQNLRRYILTSILTQIWRVFLFCS